ncbi:MAG: hypothetical protein ASARMPREDX12_001374 [Alectoria sarmentosa]|nr:MAG: hypothetical protein ASARMPREDX12_001374 [Alectoria sarmentosa]
MFPSFTGSTRPKRQVNLSGRNNNPFAALPGSRTSSSPQTAQNALAQAQHERILRQQERERPPAATKIQKIWRGYTGRKQAKGNWRHEWDYKEGWEPRETSEMRESLSQPAAVTYASKEECLGSLRLLVQFASPRNEFDIQRLDRFTTRYLQSIHLQRSGSPADLWTYPLLRLAKLSLATMSAKRTAPLSTRTMDNLVASLDAVTTAIPRQLASYSHEYFRTLAEAAINHYCSNPRSIESAALALLQPISDRTGKAYEGFTSEFLATPGLPAAFGSLDGFARGIQYRKLAAALNQVLSSSSHDDMLQLKSRDSLLWLLAYFIYFRRVAYSDKQKFTDSPDVQYVKIVSRLISFLADDIGTRIEVSNRLPLSDTSISTRAASPVEPLPAFVRSEILTLINQENVSSLLANFDVVPASSEGVAGTPSEASALASYALTLLRGFPRRGDEIRMWLFRGSTSRGSSQTSHPAKSLPAIKYFYQVASKSKIYQQISKDPRQTIPMLRPDKPQIRETSPSFSTANESRDQQWRVIFLFLELYTFVLKIMDDEEFLAGTSAYSDQWSWTRKSALPLDQVKDLTMFLKNLSFSMYWNASEIAGIEAAEVKTSLAEYFGGNKAAQNEYRQDEGPARLEDMSIAGVSGMTLVYMKGLVTGVLRMVYERDSRRKFLPKDHWLMTKYFEMDRFISAVVEEEEHRHQIQESYESNEADGKSQGGGDVDMDDDDDDDDGFALIGNSHAQQVRRAERLRRQQRKTSRRKQLESVAPRLEILQNMPFFIPFATRVQIFRQFVALDQHRRRGTSDPDMWRFAQMNSGAGDISKHRAKVRREYIFEDAYAQFYDLGEGLKEPIQIRFVDKFDTIEEGIDGGGVTKEFLTSVTNEAFGAVNGMQALFIENDQHLLYPNPSAVDERKATLQQAMYKEGSLDWNENIRDLLRRYEFLGRIIGKCLYEGILVDIHFAPFFLLKWALTGGSGSATKESGYRANLNDLRDLDEGLYQGLLQLKNYSGDVEDFSLNFAVTDTIRTSPTETKQTTRELRPSGASISVTNENRLVYISYMARHRLQIQPHLQTSAFLRGLGTIISPSWLSMFNQSELQTLVGGASSEISVSDLRANTQYGGLYAIGDDGAEHPCVQMFWKVLQSLEDSDRKKVLKFVTSTPRAPLLGFGNLNPKFSIRDSGNDQTRLPSTSTCVNLLKLPVYREEKVLRERLLYSVNAGAGFNLS